MRYQPHEYQTYATNFILTHPVSAILLECGLGKTVITLTAIHELCLDRFDVGKVLIVAPLRVCQTSWPDEIGKWDHLKGLTYSVAIGSEKERLTAIRRNAMVTIINRENLAWLVEKSGLPFEYEMVVLDELSSFKSHRTARFKSLMKVRSGVKRIVGLTGTPSSNGLMDLWAEYCVLDMGKRLGRFITRYRDTYFYPDKTNGMQVFSYKPRPGAEEAIYDRISDITISMKNTDHLNMPECVMNRVYVRLSTQEKKLYDKLCKDMVLKLDGTEIDASNAAALSGKLTQMANGAVYDEDKCVIPIHERKLDALEELIEEANGKPVLVAYWYKHDLMRIQQRIPEARQIRLPADIADWNAGNIAVGLIHPAAAGHGLNLQAGGSTLVWFGLTWSLELYQQTNARLWRQGQQAKTVVIHHILAKDTIDEEIMSALERKDKTQAALIDAVKAQLEL